ncbi:MAG: hypothetical protein ACXWCM_19420 [Acidimicrobiales bacterium]
MSFAPLTPRPSLDGVLGALPPGWAIGGREDARLVVGPTGGFVLVPGADDLSAAAERAHNLAQRTRGALARHLSWVPFIDAAVVTSGNHHAEAASIVVPVDLLSELLVKGPLVIDAPAIAVLRDLLIAGSLDDWKIAPSRDDVRIDLCDPPLQASTTAQP